MRKHIRWVGIKYVPSSRTFYFITQEKTKVSAKVLSSANKIVREKNKLFSPLLSVEHNKYLVIK